MVVPSGLFQVPCVLGAEEVDVDEVGLGLAAGAELLLGLGLAAGAVLVLGLATGLGLGDATVLGLGDALGLATVVVQLFRHVVLVEPVL
jgi:hypothetical protein